VPGWLQNASKVAAMVTLIQTVNKEIQLSLPSDVAFQFSPTDPGKLSDVDERQRDDWDIGTILGLRHRILAIFAQPGERNPVSLL